MNEVNEYIQGLQEEGEKRFRGKWLLVVHWDHVHPSPHGADEHNGIPEDELDKVVSRECFVECQLCCTCSVVMETTTINLCMYGLTGMLIALPNYYEFWLTCSSHRSIGLNSCSCSSAYNPKA